MSIAVNTIVPHSPTAAAPAIPSLPRATTHCAGRKLTSVAVARTTTASTTSRASPAGTARNRAVQTRTATPATRPTLVPPSMILRKSDPSAAAGGGAAEVVLGPHLGSLL